jgi:nucleoid-associated protein YgaU
LLQGLLAQRLYVSEGDRYLLHALLTKAPNKGRPARARGPRRAGGALLAFGGALALALATPLPPASAASPAPDAALVVADRAADNLAAQHDDALLRALLNGAATSQATSADTDEVAIRPDAALSQAELSAGQMLVIPATAADTVTTAPAAIAEQQNARTYVVQPGDTLSRIAQYVYGNGDLWPTIYNANKDKIADPHWIYPNQQLVIPPAGTTGYSVQNAPTPAQTGRGIGQYTVQPGDTLSGIAAYAYGNGNAWQRIYQANTRILANPNLIYPGQVLTIP